jgi:hypothetical protein
MSKIVDPSSLPTSLKSQMEITRTVMILLSMQKKLICIGVGEAGKYCRDAKQKD